MNTFNLDEATVSYEGQKVPVKALIKKLQEQLRDAANRLNSIAFVLNELYASIENSRFIELRLSLSQGEYEKFQALTGETDREKLRKALQLLPLTDTSEPTSVDSESPDKQHPSPIPPISEKILYTAEKSTGSSTITQTTGSDSTPGSGLKRNTIRCPRCKNLMDIPEISTDQWPIEAKCGHCGAKCLIKSKNSGNPLRKDAIDTMEDPPYGKMFDMLST